MIAVKEDGPFDKIALIGTSKAGAAVDTGTPVDAFVASLTDVEPARAALLAAGAFEAYRQAAFAPARGVPPAPAKSDDRPECGPTFAAIFREVLQGEWSDALPEAAACLRRAGQRLADHLLPAALDRREPEMRRALYDVLGQRGAWLAQFREEWRWALVGAAVADTLPPDAEQRFQESRPAERYELLRRARSIEPATARKWVEAVWSQEKPETRGTLVEALAIGVSADDEAFIESCRDDRSVGVRKAANQTALLIPGSAAAARAIARAERCLGDKAAIEPPKSFDKEWGKDGLSEAAPSGRGARGWWLAQIVATTPPEFWVARWKRSPLQLIKEANEGDHADDLCEGWAEAALRHGAVEWIEPLFDRWREHHPKRSVARIGDRLADRLFHALPHDKAIATLQRLFAGRATAAMDSQDAMRFSHWQGDWNVELGRHFVKWLHARLECASDHGGCDDVEQLLPTCAFRIPIECVPESPIGEHLPEPTSWALKHLHTTVAKFNAAIEFRRRLHAEAVSSAPSPS